MAKPNPKLVAQAVNLGLAYGPAAIAAAKKAGWTPENLLHRQIEKTDARMHALEHADHLVDGSVLTVFEGDKRIFVVFTGDKPVATHPQTKTPLPQLIEGYDLAKRVRPGTEEGRAIPVPRLRRRRKGPRRVGETPAPQGIEGGQNPSGTPRA